MAGYDPFLSTNPVVGALEQHRGRVEQVRENSARIAQSFATYTTTGVGEFEIEEPHTFGCTFSEQPIVAYGSSLNGEQLVPGQFPRIFGSVREWITDTRGFYIGAYVFFVIDVPDAALAPEYVVDHDLTFTAVALKDLPAYLLA